MLKERPYGKSRLIAMMVATTFLLSCAPDSGDDNPALIYDFPYPAQLPAVPDPPDPLTSFFSAEQVRTPGEWPARRAEIQALFEQYVYGKAPEPPETIDWRVVDESAEAMDGTATRRRIEIRIAGEGGPVWRLLVYIPNGLESPVGVFLGLNFYGNHTVINDPAVPLSEEWIPERGEGVIDNHATEASRGTVMDRWSIAQTLAQGWAVATIYHGDIDPDYPNDSNGIQPVYYEDGQSQPKSGEWGTVAAWAWGLSRGLDVLLTNPEIDANRIIAVGHSRNAKSALLAAAFDERFAAVAANQAGCTGAAISRRHLGETVMLINTVFPHWFSENYHAFNEREDHLPVDQHLLIAMIAPRPALILSAEDDSWSDPEGEFLGALGAEPVYRLLEAGELGTTELPPVNQLIGEGLSYHLRPGDHSIGSEDWAVITRFAENIFR